MSWKKGIVLIFFLFLLGGCASGGMMAVGNIANVLGGEKAAKSKNPFIEAEIDLVLVDELSAIVKLNQVMLERMPISYEDLWPELLNDYYKKVSSKKERKRKNKYDKCLENLLKKDFSFFRLYNPDAYMSYVIAQGSILGAIGSRAFVEGVKILGKEFEHTKSVLSYVPFGCECAYFRTKYRELTPRSRECRIVKRDPIYRKCEFFNKPTDVLLTKYLFQAGGMKHWADLPIELICFRPVRGEHLGTFKEVFYSLLDPSVRAQIQRIDDELMADRAELESIKAQLNNRKDLSPAERAALKKRKEILSRTIKTKIAIQKKLYKRALNQLNVSWDNIKKAKKLKEVADYIDRSFKETLGVMLNLTLKIVTDIQTIKKTNIAVALATYPMMMSKGVFSVRDRNFYKKRFELVSKKLVALPVTYFEILGYAIAQKYQVAKYREYLNALIKMEKKIKKARRR